MPLCSARNTRNASLKRASVITAPRPVGGAEPLQIPALDRIRALPGRGAVGLAYAEHEQRDREKARNRGDPEHGAEIVRPQQHQADREQRPHECAHGIERLAKPECGAANLRWRDIGDQRIARCAAYPLPTRSSSRAVITTPVEEATANRELGQRAERIAEQCESLALAEVIAQRPGEDLHDKRRRFRQSLDDPDDECAGAEGAHHEQRQEAVDHLGGDIHQHADEAENPDAGRNARALSGLRHVMSFARLARLQGRVSTTRLSTGVFGPSARRRDAERPHRLPPFDPVRLPRGPPIPRDARPAVRDPIIAAGKR
jgi:hypothetical protein